MPRNCKISSPVVFACLAILLIAAPAFSQSAAAARTLPNTQILGTEDPTSRLPLRSGSSSTIKPDSMNWSGRCTTRIRPTTIIG